jgi:REP element-mobilizing transposase RayT
MRAFLAFCADTCFNNNMGSRYSEKERNGTGKGKHGKVLRMEQKRSMSQKLRMDGRDYAWTGWYFVTLGADYHKQLFGSIQECEMHPNALGRLVERCWGEIPQHYDHIALGAWQLMPNHFHGLVRIVRSGGKGLGEVMNVFKGAVTREWRRSLGLKDSRCSEKVRKVRVWAPNYYDVICFDAEELEVKERYVKANPRRWALRDVPEGTIKQSRFRGNIELLEQPGERRALRVSRKAAKEQITALKENLSKFDGIVCSTFFSPGERACLETLQKGSACIMWVMPMAMPKNIPERWTDAFLEKRALWLSAFSDEQEAATRANCEQANRWVEQFCVEVK